MTASAASLTSSIHAFNPHNRGLGLPGSPNLVGRSLLSAQAWNHLCRRACLA